MLAFRETKFSRSCRQSYTRLRNGRWLISRSRRLRLSRCWKRRTDYQQNFKAKSRSLTVIRKRRGLVRRPDPANLLGLANTKEKQMASFVGAWRIFRRMDLEAFDLPGMGDDDIDVPTILDRTTIDMHSCPHAPSESKIERRSKTEAPRAFAPASRSGKHPAYRQLFAPFFFTGVQSTWHHLAAIQRPAHPARRRPGGASDTGHRREDDRTGAGYNPPVGSLGREEVRAPGTPFR